KGFDVLFEAWVQVIDQRPDAKLTVVGVGDAAPWQAYLAGHAKASESVTFMGRLDDPYEAYLGAGVFVLPSRVEGMSNALLEAQSSGLACVVSDIPGNRAVVSHDVNGLTVPVGDAGALAEGMLRLLGDTDLRARLGHAAREHMEQRFGLARVVDQLTDLYRSLVEN
ncbi:MAG: glycosyltransferase, partial [Kiritimatiellae bacterium]|nr:glycosyltransferase [Kiritimatiellia bacterium]